LSCMYQIHSTTSILSSIQGRSWDFGGPGPK
jgi:hypothetical protein